MKGKKTTVFCDKCGACSDNINVVVVCKKARCYTCLIHAGLQNLLSEQTTEEFEERVKGRK